MMMEIGKSLGKTDLFSWFDGRNYYMFDRIAFASALKL